jgi:hypothetical protein
VFGKIFSEKKGQRRVASLVRAAEKAVRPKIEVAKKSPWMGFAAFLPYRLCGAAE